LGNGVMGGRARRDPSGHGEVTAGPNLVEASREGQGVDTEGRAGTVGELPWTVGGQGEERWKRQGEGDGDEADGRPAGEDGVLRPDAWGRSARNQTRRG
jgi:hypothetical protein